MTSSLPNELQKSRFSLVSIFMYALTYFIVLNDRELLVRSSKL